MVDELVRFDMVHKVFKEKTVIGKVDLRVGRGEVVALCGGNGAGKSTLLRMLVGILHPTCGVITVNGLSWQADRRHYAQQIGYMPDDYRFSLGLTALETLHFWAKLRGLSKERVLEVLSLVGLSDKLNRQVSSFSKGMRQRVLFAQALLAAPPLIVMDEPTNGLDPYWMETFIHLVRQSASNGHTILFSTHQLQIAEALADRIVFLRDGNIVLDGKKEHIYQEHGADGLQQLFGELFGIRSGL